VGLVFSRRLVTGVISKSRHADWEDEHGQPADGD
jgi:hypothetical protein